MTSEREMNLEEWVFKLAPFHRARKEFEFLTAEVEKLKEEVFAISEAYVSETLQKQQAEEANANLREALEKIENFLLGLHRDPAIPNHTRDAVFVKASEIDNALKELKP